MVICYTGNPVASDERHWIIRGNKWKRCSEGAVKKS